MAVAIHKAERGRCSHFGGNGGSGGSRLLIYQAITRYDPTRTLTLRNAFVRDMDKRFRTFIGRITGAVVDQDVFALAKGSGGFTAMAGARGPDPTLPGRHAFDFPRSGDKVDAFMGWLGRQEQIFLQTEGGSGLRILPGQQLGTGIEAPWTNKYVTSAYQQGIHRARQELIGAGFDVPNIEKTGGIGVAFNQPFHLDRVGLLYSRTFSQLKGITGAMDAQISQVLAKGMAEGRNPRELGRMLSKTITGMGADLGITDALGRYIPAQRRAQTLARTEVIRAHHQATIQEYRNWAVAGVRVLAEWQTAGDPRVCEWCAGMARRAGGALPKPTAVGGGQVAREIPFPGKVGEKVQWDSLKTVNEVSKQLRRFGIRDVDLPESIDRADALKTLKSLGKHLEDLFKRRPGVAQFLSKNVDQRGLFNFDVKNVYQVGLGTLGIFSPSSHSVTMGYKYLVDSKKGIFSPGALRLGGYTVGSGALSSFRHEYGHALREVLHSDPKLSMFSSYWDNVVRSLSLEEVGRTVSKYAANNYREAFAESFAAWAHPDYGKSLRQRLPKQIEGFFDRLFGV